MSAESPAIRFEPVRESTVERWSKPKRFDFLHRLPVVPIADTELLHLSHYCPAVIALADDGPRVLILLDPAMLLYAPVDKNGRWRAPYAPIAIRSLPFWPGDKLSEIHVAPELVSDTADASFALLDDSGDPSKQFGAVAAWIERLQLGMRRLSEATKVLIAADLLAPLVVNQPGMSEPVETGYFTVSFEKLRALSATRMAAFTADRCLPLDLVTACVFSRRLLARRVTSRKIEAEGPWSPGSNERDFDFIKAFDIDLGLDTSPLFSFEEFAGSKPGLRENENHVAS